MPWPYERVTSTTLSAQLGTITQRTGGATGALRTDSDRVAFQVSTKEDLANVVAQLNQLYYNLARTLANEDSLDALQYGLSGNVIYTDIDAEEGSASAYWDDGLARGRTIRETIDVLLSEIARLESLVGTLTETAAASYDDSALSSLIETNSQNIDQIALDAFGPDYTLDGDGLADLVYSLAQHIDEIGSLITGFPGTGLTYTGAPAYPAMTITSNSAFLTTLNVTNNSPGDFATDDFVFGSPELDWDADTDHEHKFQFDKSKAAWRGGYVYSDVWDAVNVGDYTFGWNNIEISGSGSVGLSEGSLIESDSAGIFTGQENSILDGSSNSAAAFIGGGWNNIISNSAYSVVAGGGHTTAGQGNEILTSVASFIGSGRNNVIGITTSSTNYSVIVGGKDNDIGVSGVASFLNCFIGGGESNAIGAFSADHSSILGGFNNSIGALAAADFGSTLGGDSCSVNADHGTTVGGKLNVVSSQYGVAQGHGATVSHYAGHARSSGFRAAAGDNQEFNVIFLGQTPGNTPTEIFIGGVASNRLTIPLATTYAIRVTASAQSYAGSANTAAYFGNYLVKNVAGTVTVTADATGLTAIEDNAAWNFTVTADSVNDAVVFTVTGEANVDVQWTVNVQVVKAS